jgi:ABC-type sulfate transport system substrate-binding protein
MGASINLGRSSYDLSREEFAQLIEVVHEWAARNGVKFTQSSGEG